MGPITFVVDTKLGGGFTVVDGFDSGALLIGFKSFIDFEILSISELSMVTLGVGGAEVGVYFEFFCDLRKLSEFDSSITHLSDFLRRFANNSAPKG